MEGLLLNILFPLYFFSDGFPKNNVSRCILLFDQEDFSAAEMDDVFVTLLASLFAFLYFVFLHFWEVKAERG